MSVLQARPIRKTALSTWRNASDAAPARMHVLPRPFHRSGEYPPQQPKEDSTADALRALIQSKAKAENTAEKLPGALSAAVKKSSRLMAEDLCRESGFMLPQSENARNFLEQIKNYPDVPIEIVERLLSTISFNEKPKEDNTEKWKCSVCGYIHEGPMTPDFKCPVCRQGADRFVKVG